MAQIPNLVPTSSVTNVDLLVTRQSGVDKNFSLLVLKRYLGVPDVGITPFMKTVLDDATDTLARSTLGVTRATTPEAKAGESSTTTMSPSTTKEAIFVHAVPAGSPVLWPTSTVPTGWKECDGSSFNTTTYPQLAIAYPSGNVVDMRGEFARGWDHGRGVDIGRTIASTQTDEFKEHSHNNPTGGSTTGVDSGSARTCATNVDGPTSLEGGVETRPRNISFMYIVRLA